MNKSKSVSKISSSINRRFINFCDSEVDKIKYYKLNNKIIKIHKKKTADFSIDIKNEINKALPFEKKNNSLKLDSFSSDLFFCKNILYNCLDDEMLKNINQHDDDIKIIKKEITSFKKKQEETNNELKNELKEIKGLIKQLMDKKQQ